MKEFKMLIWLVIVLTLFLFNRLNITNEEVKVWGMVLNWEAIAGFVAAVFAFLAYRQSSQAARNSLRPLLIAVIENQRNENHVVTGLKVILANRGVGPAILTEYVFHYNGEHLSQPSECLDRIEEIHTISMGDAVRLNFLESRDTAISAGKSLTIFEVNQSAILHGNLTHLQLRNIVRNEISFEIKYESVYGDSFDLNR